MVLTKWQLFRISIMMVCLLTTGKTLCQTDMRVYFQNGRYKDFPIEGIDSISFLERGEAHAEISLLGSWLYGSVQMGYYELLTFNEDKSYLGYDNYFTYGLETETYGWYVDMGNILTLQSNGFGYQRTHRWFVTSLTKNALEVMTQMGRFVYYRLQDEVIHLKVSSSPFVCKNGEECIFADGVTTKVADNQLVGLSVGISYVQMLQTATNTIVAYKVVVEP